MRPTSIATPMSATAGRRSSASSAATTAADKPHAGRRRSNSSHRYSTIAVTTIGIDTVWLRPEEPLHGIVSLVSNVLLRWHHTSRPRRVRGRQREESARIRAHFMDVRLGVRQ
jgi:hypothetical protein